MPRYPAPTLRKKTRYTRRPKRRKRKDYTATIHMPVPFPQKIRTNLTYTQRVQVNPAALTYSYLFNLNSIFDPDRSGVGHQPCFHDELALLYNRYRVLAFSYEFILSGLNTSARYYVLPMNGVTPPVDLNDAIEGITSAKSGIVTTDASGGPNAIKIIKGYVSLKKLLGEDLSDDRDQAVMGSNPVNQATLALGLESLNGSTNLSSVNLTIKFRYHVEIFDRKNPIGS